MKQQRGSRRPDGAPEPVVTGRHLIVTPEGFPLSYEVMRGNTADSTTLRGFLGRIEQRYWRAKRIWVMDLGVPSEDSLATMRSVGASYVVGTPKGRLSKLEASVLGQP